MGIFNKITLKIYDCARLNTYIIIGIICGGILFGIGPSLFAASDQVREVTKKNSFSLATFWKSYKRNFKQGNVLFLPLVFSIMIFLGGYYIFLDTWLSWVYTILLLYSLSILWIGVSISSYYHLLNGSILYLSLKMSIYNIFLTIEMILINLALVQLFLFVPGILLFLGVGLSSLVNVLVCYSFFKFNEEWIKEVNRFD